MELLNEWLEVMNEGFSIDLECFNIESAGLDCVCISSDKQSNKRVCQMVMFSAAC